MKIIKRNKNDTLTDKDFLIQEIEMTKQAINNAYSNFDNCIDPDLIDCYIYQLQSEQKRYTYLLQKFRKYDD